MTEVELIAWCEELGESNFRGKQLFEWMYRQGAMSFEKMTNISKTFRSYLMSNCIIRTLSIEKSLTSNLDQSVKFLFRTEDDHFIESVSMIDENRHTICISSQIGCALDCSFCETGKMGLNRNLSTGEIVDQLLFIK